MPHRPVGLAVVGSISADVTAFGSPLPRPGETVIGDSFSLVLGGKGANQALAARRAGVATFMIGCVGDDLFRDLTLGSLAAEGVNTDAVSVVDGHTGIAHIRVDSTTGQNDIAVIPLANTQTTPDLAERQLRSVAESVSVLLLQLEIPTETAVRAAAVGHELGLTVILDPAPAVRLPDEIWPWIDIVTPNEIEVSIMTGIEVTDHVSAIAAGRWYTDRGAGCAVITLAERGAVEVRAESDATYPAFPVAPIDTTAAGDAFAGSLGASLASSTPWDVAISRALAAGALAVTIRGASPSLPTAAQVDAFIASH